MSNLNVAGRRIAATATDVACQTLGRRAVIRTARYVLRRARLDYPNDMTVNGESALQRWVLGLAPDGELHVADVGAAFAALLDSEVQGAVNIGSGDAVSLAELLESIAAQIGRPELLRLGARDAPASEPPLLVPKVERLRQELGWHPRFDLHEGLADTIAWWRQALQTSG